MGQLDRLRLAERVTELQVVDFVQLHFGNPTKSYHASHETSHWVHGARLPAHELRN
jgi:hypothetical protein